MRHRTAEQAEVIVCDCLCIISSEGKTILREVNPSPRVLLEDTV